MTRDAVAATSGAANDVPCPSRTPLLTPTPKDNKFTPGAMTSIQAPRLLNGAMPRVSLIAPTLRTPSPAAGYLSRVSPSFPAAAITNAPCARASAMASRSSGDICFPDCTNDSVMTSAPLLAAQRIPSAISRVVPLPPFITRTSSRSAFQSKPAVPIALSLIAPINPAIKVP